MPPKARQPKKIKKAVDSDIEKDDDDKTIEEKKPIVIKDKSKQPKRIKKAVDSDIEKDDDYKIEEDKNLIVIEDDVEEKKIRKKLSKYLIKSDSDSGVDILEDSDDDFKKQKTKKTKRNSSGKKSNQDSQKEMNLAKGKVKGRAKKEGKKPNSSRSGEIKKDVIDIDDGPSLDHVANQDNNVQEISISDIYMPDWAMEPKLRDKQGRKSNDINYDATTLYIPNDGLKDLSATMNQYWLCKSVHFNKIIVMKIWKFYYIYGVDAYNVGKMIDMKLNRWGKWNFVFFHESCLARFTPPLLAAGHKLVVLEQMEEHKGSKDVIRREACQVLTRGTYIETNPNDYNSKFLMCIFEESNSIGIVYLDATTHEFHIGEFQDDENKSSLRTILFRVKPVEVCYSKDYISKETISMLQGLSNKPTLSPIRKQTTDLEDILLKMKSYFKKRNEGDHTGNFPSLLKNIKESIELEFKNKPQNEKNVPFYSTLHALNISLEYLEQVMLAETVFTMGNFLAFDITIDKTTTLYLDSQTLQNLEIIEVSYLTSLNEANSLLEFMDRTKTPYGKRMFKRWLTSPLIDSNAINDRLDAVEDLMKNVNMVEYYQNTISKLPDLERMINKIYNLSNKQRMSACYFEDFAINRLHDFLDYLK